MWSPSLQQVLYKGTTRTPGKGAFVWKIQYLLAVGPCIDFHDFGLLNSSDYLKHEVEY